jgi:hypothetical protein
MNLPGAGMLLLRFLQLPGLSIDNVVLHVKLFSQVRARAKRNTAPGIEKSRPSPNFLTTNNVKFPGTEKITFSNPPSIKMM